MRRFIGLLLALLITLPAVAGAMSHLWRCDQHPDSTFALTADDGSAPVDGDCCPTGAFGLTGARGCAGSGDCAACLASPALLPGMGLPGIADLSGAAAPAYRVASVGAPPPGLPWRPPAA